MGGDVIAAGEAGVGVVEQHMHRLAVAARAARAAIGRAEGVAGRHGAAAVAAAAAHRLGEDPHAVEHGGVAAAGPEPRLDIAAVGDHDHVGVHALGAVAAGREQALGVASVAAPAADRFRQDPVRARSLGGQHAGIGHGDRAALGGPRAVAAEREGRPGAAAIAPAAADAVGLDGVGGEALGGDVAGVVHRDCPAFAAAAAVAAQRAAADVVGPVAAAAADGLGVDALGIVAVGDDPAVGEDVYVLGVAARAAAAAA